MTETTVYTLEEAMERLSLHRWDVTHWKDGSWTVAIWEGDTGYYGRSEDSLLTAIDDAIRALTTPQDPRRTR